MQEHAHERPRLEHEHGAEREEGGKHEVEPEAPDHADLDHRVQDEHEEDEDQTASVRLPSPRQKRYIRWNGVGIVVACSMVVQLSNADRSLPQQGGRLLFPARLCRLGRVATNAVVRFFRKRVEEARQRVRNREADEGHQCGHSE